MRRRRQLWRSLERLESVAPEVGAPGEAAGAEVASPCTGVCRLDGNDVCADCHRTLDEIADWSGLSAAAKRDVLAAAARRAASG